MSNGGWDEDVLHGWARQRIVIHCKLKYNLLEHNNPVLVLPLDNIPL